MKKITIRDIQKFKGDETPFATITAYDYISARNADAVDIPLLLVGDSAAMVVYGMDNTIPISMDELIFLVRAVYRGTEKHWLLLICPLCHISPPLRMLSEMLEDLLKKEVQEQSSWKVALLTFRKSGQLLMPEYL